MLIEADVLLYYISLLFPNSKSYMGGYWFPETSCYRFYKLRVLSKTISERYFNKVKVLFGVQTKAELSTKTDEIILVDQLFPSNYCNWKKIADEK